MGKWVVKGTRTYYGEGNTWGRTLYNSEEPSAVGEKWLIFCVVPCCAVLSRSVVFDSLWPHGLWPARLLWPWDFPGKNTGVGCHTLLQGIFPTQGWNPCLLHCRQILYLCITGEALCVCVCVYAYILTKKLILISFISWVWNLSDCKLLVPSNL